LGFKVGNYTKNSLGWVLTAKGFVSGSDDLRFAMAEFQISNFKLLSWQSA
jgi:hypothetical protein